MKLPPFKGLALCLALHLTFAAAGRGEVVISEFMAVNLNSAYEDEDNSKEDWLELHNAGIEAVSLNGWYLTDDAEDLRKWRFPVTTPAVSLPSGGRLVVWCSNKNRTANAAALHTNFKLSREGEYLALVNPDGITVEHEYAPAYPLQVTDKSYGISGGTSLLAYVGPSPTATSYTLNVKARVASMATQHTDGWQNTSYVDTAWTARSLGLSGGLYAGLGVDTTPDAPHAFLIHPSGALDATPAMLGVNASVQVRCPFTVADKSLVRSLQLKMQYEDGFIAYLNGTKILEANAPAAPAYDSVCTLDREDDQGEDVDFFNLPGAQNYLVNGSNVLAIQGLNNTAANGYFLLIPKLEGLVGTSGTQGPVGYLQQPSPGLENTVASTTVGPDVSSTTQNPTRPAPNTNAAFVITTKVTPTLNPVQTVVLRYVKMWDQSYGLESSLSMKDDGLGADAIAGDKIYTASISGSYMQTLLESQMLRWRVQATDTAGNITKDPAYLNPVDSDAYYGTITQTPGISTNLPLLVWFSSTQATYTSHGSVHNFSQAASNNRYGKFCSFYFKQPNEANGRFYDNARVGLHGQTTASFAKKSQNVNFNDDNPFVWKTGESTVKNINLLSNYADKSKVRTPMVWEFWNKTRHPSHWCQPVRVQQIIPATVTAGVAAQFYGIWDMVEDANRDFLRRCDLNPDGALYKVYNSLQNANQTTNNSSGVEKKTREWEDFSDLQSMVTALNTSNTLNARRQWAYDNVNIPSLINMLAVHAFVRSNDFGHKNYYVYRDTPGNGEWSTLPWDQDLSFGHTYVATSGYFDDNIDSARGLLIGNAPNNALMRLALNESGTHDFARMYLRRIRTLMDTYLGPEIAPVNHFESRVAAWLALMDPNAGNYAGGSDDADLDFRKWGFWLDGSGTAYAYTDGNAPLHFVRQHCDRMTLVTGNPHPTYPGSAPYAPYGTDPVVHSSLPAFLPGRRSFLYRTDASRPNLYSSLYIPPAQPAAPPLVIQNITANPGSAGQDQEYFIIRNTGTEAVDISDWKVTGAVEHLFEAGTVIPGTGTSTSDGTSSAWANQLILTQSAKAFRARTVTPKAGEYRHIQDGYVGQLSARGGTIELRKPDNPLDLANSSYSLVATQAYAGAPTAAQTNLRVTEILYHPENPSANEEFTTPGVTDEDFEFIELINNGPTALGLGGARVQGGIDFTFPAGYSLAAGARCLLVAYIPAFQLRYGNGLNALIAGEYAGRLDNTSDQITILDSVGEVVLDFSYSDTWYPITDSSGHSLVTTSNTLAHDVYGNLTSWTVSGEPGGTPGAQHTTVGVTYETWRNTYFTQPEFATLGGVDHDPDNDGRLNLTEYAFGGNPRLADLSGATSAALVQSGDNTFLSLTYTRRRSAVDLLYLPEYSTTMAEFDWTQLFLPYSTTTDAGNGMDAVQLTGSDPVTDPRGFMRVRALRTP